MPIYAYRCAACGHAQDVLQKISDPLLTVCPACGAPAFQKQVTAAGFQLKGSGWYVTDFRGGNGAPKKDDKANEGAAAPAADGADQKAAPAESPAPAAAADKPAASAPSATPPPAAGT